MEANRDEAIKCARLAEKYARNGDRETALRFIRKARKLDPTMNVRGMFRVSFDRF